jgi:ubiquinone/menaquinone biosynthesis C-methylase UbiE
MPSPQQNYETWNHFYDWSRYQGDEWSAKWGGPDMQWYWTLLPRLSQHLPTETILLIGPGYGRWAKYLLEHCERMVMVDISEKCIHACKERFGTDRISYRVGPGDSVDFLEDESIDFVFSFETLVYCELDALSSYLQGLGRKLKPRGTGFLHHSNLGAYSGYFNRTLKLPKGVRDFLKKRGLLDFDQWRARSVTAELMKEQAEQAGLHVWTQELIPWGGKRLIDCFSTVGREPAKDPFKILENPWYHKRAYDIQRLSWMYGEGVPW